MSFSAFTLISTCVFRAHLCLISAASNTTFRQLKAVIWKPSVQAPNTGAKLNFTNWRICPLLVFNWGNGISLQRQCLEKCLGRNRHSPCGAPSIQGCSCEGTWEFAIQIKGIFTENCVCTVYFWKGAVETGMSGLLGRWRECQGSKGGKGSHCLQCAFFF